MIDISKVQTLTTNEQYSLGVDSTYGKAVTDVLDATIMKVAQAGRDSATITIYAKGKELIVGYEAVVEVDLDSTYIVTLGSNIKQAYAKEGYNATGAYSADNTNYYLTVSWAKDPE